MRRLLPLLASLVLLVPGPGDQSQWFIDGAKVGRINSVFAPGAVVFGHTFDGTPTDLVAANNSTMWIIDSSGDITCATNQGQFFAKESQLASPTAITRAANGDLWYVDTTANRIARLIPTACTD